MGRKYEDIKGVVVCPHCHKGKVIVSQNTAGWTSQQCPKCGGFFIIDLDTMKVKPAKRLKNVCGMVEK